MYCEKALSRRADAKTELLKEDWLAGYKNKAEVRKKAGSTTIDDKLVVAVVDWLVGLTDFGAGGTISRWLCAGDGSVLWLPWLLLMSGDGPGRGG